MMLRGKCALITGSSRGIGRGVALKLAESGARVAIHYYQNEAAAKDTLAQVEKRDSSGFVVQADVLQPKDISRMFDRVRAEFGSLDILVSNARPEVPAFFQPPLDITLEQWDTAVDSQAKAFLLAVREGVRLMPDGSRIVAITYGTGSRTGSLQPWVGMGSAKAAMESLVRYFGVALAKRGITVNAISPGWTEDSVLNYTAGSGTRPHPKLAQERLDTNEAVGHPSRYRECYGAALRGRSRLDYGPGDLRRWWRVAAERGSPARDPVWIGPPPCRVRDPELHP